MRCLTLARAWLTTGRRASIVGYSDSRSPVELIESLGVEWVSLEGVYPDPTDLTGTFRVLESLREATGVLPWLVVDGYHFDEVYHSQLEVCGCRTLVVDDLNHLSKYSADIVLNQNINSERFEYVHSTNTRLLLGTSYALLRPEFRLWRDWERDRVLPARRILVTLGGGDVTGPTLTAIRGLQSAELHDIEVTVIVGPASPSFEQLQEAVDECQFRIEIIRNSNNMAELMSWADLAISAGGSTCWEMAFMRLPNIILMTADNQQHVVAGLDESGVAVSLGWWEEVDEQILGELVSELLRDSDRRTEMGQLGRRLVDGCGTERVIEAITEDNNG